MTQNNKTTRKGLIIHTNGGEVEELILGRLYYDGSFGKMLRLYIDEKNIFQIEFLTGSSLAYSFLPECTKLLEILRGGFAEADFGVVADEFLQNGWTEVTEK